MTQYQSASFKIDLSNPTHRKAMQYLSSMDREKFPTVGDAIVTAVVAYFEGGQVTDTNSPGTVAPVAGVTMPGQEQPAPVAGVAMPGQEQEQSALESHDAPSTMPEDLEAAIEKAVESSLARILPAYFEKYGQISPAKAVEEDTASSSSLEDNELSGMENEIDWGFLGG